MPKTSGQRMGAFGDLFNVCGGAVCVLQSAFGSELNLMLCFCTLSVCAHIQLCNILCGPKSRFE